MFFAGGVLPGVVGRIGCGVSCLDGVPGFLLGVGCLDFGVKEGRFPKLFLALLRFWMAAILGLPVSEAIPALPECAGKGLSSSNPAPKGF